MADDVLGELSIDVTADLSDLSDKLGQAVEDVQQAGQEIAQAMDFDWSGVESGLAGVGEAMQTAAETAGGPLRDAMGRFTSSAEDAGNAADAGAAQLDLFAQAAQTAAQTLESIPKQGDLFDVNSIEAEDEALGSLAQGFVQLTAEQQAAADAAAAAAAAQAEALAKINAAAQEHAAAVKAVETEYEELQAALKEAQANLALVQQMFEQGAASAGQVEEAMKGVDDALVALNGAEKEASGGLAYFLEGFAEMGARLAEFFAFMEIVDILKEITLGSVEASDAFEKMAISLGAVINNTAQATEELEGLKNLAMTDALSFPQIGQAQVQMRALGLSAQQTSQLLQDAANAAAVMGSDIGTMSSQLERMVTSGNLMTRSLAGMGISVQSLATIMGTDAASITESFKALDQSQRIEVLNQAMAQFGGVAAQQANTISGALQQLKNQFEFFQEGVGNAIAPLIKDFLQFAQTVIPALENVGAMLRDSFEPFAESLDGTIQSLRNLQSTLEPLEALVGGGLAGSFKELADEIGLAAAGLSNLVGWIAQGTANMVTMLSKAADIPQIADWIEKLTGAGKDNTIQTDAMSVAWNGFNTTIAVVKNPLLGILDVIGQVAQKFNEMASQANVAETALALNTTRNAQATKNLADALVQAQLAQDKDKISLGQLSVAHQQLVTNLANAQHQLDLVNQAFANGTASRGQLVAATNAVTQAHDALYGPATAAAGAVQSIYKPVSQGLTEKLAVDMLNTMIALQQAKVAAAGFADYAAQAVSSVGQLAPLTVLTAQEQTAYKDAVTQSDQALQSILNTAAQLPPAFSLADAPLKNVVQGTKDWNTAMSQLGLDGKKSLDQALEDIQVLDKNIASGKVTSDQMADSWANLEQHFKNSVPALQAILQDEIAHGAAAAQILQTEIDINNEEIKQAEARGQSTLALQQQHTLLQAQQGDVQLLANLYTSMTNSLTKAWSDIGKGIADAAVDGQNFGQAMTAVLRELEKEIVEELVGNAFKALGQAILQNTDAVNAWNKLFNGIFGTDGTVQNALNSTSQAASETADAVAHGIGQIDDSVATMSNSFQSAGTKISQSMQQTASSVQSSASSMVSSLNVVANVISAIASIIGDFEMAHMEKTLGQIETNTRITYTLIQQGDGLLQWTKTAGQCLQLVNTQLDLLGDKLMAIDGDIQSGFSSVIDALKTISVNTGSGGGAGTTTADLSQLLIAMNDGFAKLAGLVGMAINAITASGGVGGDSGITPVITGGGGGSLGQPTGDYTGIGSPMDSSSPSGTGSTTGTGSGSTTSNPSAAWNAWALAVSQLGDTNQAISEAITILMNHGETAQQAASELGQAIGRTINITEQATTSAVSGIASFASLAQTINNNLPAAQQAWYLAESQLGNTNAAIAQAIDILRRAGESGQQAASELSQLLGRAITYTDQGPGYGGGVASTDQYGNVQGAPSGTFSPYVGSGPGGLTVQVFMNGGMVVGNNGMNQFTDMMMQKIVSKLSTTAGLKIR